MARSRPQEIERDRKLALVLSMLNDGQMVPSWKIANKLGVSLRSVHRYVDCLRQTGFDIDGCKGHGGGLVILGRKRKVPVAIQRIIDEVTIDEPVGGYNRTYHRHNR